MSLAKLGKAHTEDHNLKISQSLLGKKHSKKRKAAAYLTKYRMPIICNETGIVYVSITAAAHALNGSVGYLGNHLAGLKKTYKGFTFKYLAK